MRVIISVENDRAREQLIEQHGVLYWSKEHDQLVTWNVYNAAQSIGGGIHLHKDKGKDIFYPEIHDKQVETVNPDILIVSALDESRIGDSDDKARVMSQPDNQDVSYHAE